ncbi:unnamed protein product [Mytilus edulis]|uniref:Uncharacterized protein n=1 Tax=Mytilus edulis TaxID=6550 RepID=A0A8S3UG16_MYTED|nr:unnamed protein product [Mytilus edulis]
MEKDTTKLWNLTKALNDEGSKGQKITLEVKGKKLQEKLLQMHLQKVMRSSGVLPSTEKKTTGTLFTLSPKTQSVKLILDDTPLKMEDQQTYLGVTFDKRMTWKQHITSAEAKARRKLNIMRKLAGTKWGANEKILKSVYQINVRPHLECGSSAWMTAAKCYHQTSDKVQNQALRFITGAMK